MTAMRFRFKIIIFVFLLVIPLVARADTWGQKMDFFVDPFYDEFTRNKVTATLRKISSKVYFYFEDDFWNSLSFDSQDKIIKATEELSSEFENRIYPTLISNFGSEWLPGIDKDERIAILIHPMGKGIGGYFSSSDEYSKFEFPRSNEREMIYLNSRYISSSLAKTYLAHEFIHLITFNQKTKIYGVSEETWLNEARTEYASTLLGYDENFEGSNLEIRLKEFLKTPSDSLTEWKNRQSDYGVINLFTQYLVDHYGVKILDDSLKLPEVGIKSINYALTKNGFSENFSKIFVDWTITVLINDCAISEKYCYSNQHLKGYVITPFINYLPVVGESSLSITNFTKDWMGSWYKIVGGKGVLKIDFTGEKEINFQVLYVVTDKAGKNKINFLTLDKDEKGTIYVPDFNTENNSVTIIPLTQVKISDFSSSESAHQFSFVVSTVETTPEAKEEQIKKLLAQIDFLQKEIARVRAQIDAVLGKGETQISCSLLERDLSYGTTSSQVKCLQEFLKSQGAEIYPEGLVTGFFGDKTQAAVKRFQEKYSQEILFPIGLKEGTGYVGTATRAKINQILGYQS